MEWSDIRIFLQVVRDGTMTEATGSLRMDHSTISRRIARLEKDAGVPLFEHTGRRISITQDGLRMAEAAAKLESIILREISTLAENKGTVSGRVRIGATECFGVHYLAQHLAQIAGEHAALEIELVSLPRNFSLATREVDLVITLDRPNSGDIKYSKLTSFAFGLYCTRTYFSGRPRPGNVGDLNDETWCGYVADMLHTTELVVDGMPRQAAEPRFRMTSITAQLETVSSGQALAILPCFVVRDGSHLERLFPTEINPLRDYWLAVHEDLAPSPRVRAVIRAIQGLVVRDRLLFLGGGSPLDSELLRRNLGGSPYFDASPQSSRYDN